jgi:hypothetical protein
MVSLSNPWQVLFDDNVLSPVRQAQGDNYLSGATTLPLFSVMVSLSNP